MTPQEIWDLAKTSHIIAIISLIAIIIIAISLTAISIKYLRN